MTQNGTATAELTALPHSGLRVPDTNVKVTALKGNLTTNGYAFTANLKRGAKLVGSVQNEGRGGGTWFYPAGAVNGGWNRNEFDEFVKACRDKAGNPVDAEKVLDDLVEECESPKNIAKLARKGLVAVRKVETADIYNGTMEFLGEVFGIGSAGDDLTAAAVDPAWRNGAVRTISHGDLAPGPKDRLEVWTGTAWEKLPTLDEVNAVPHEYKTKPSVGEAGKVVGYCACGNWRTRPVTDNTVTVDLLYAAFQKHTNG